MPIPPPTIGRYEIQRVLGRGAMGVVYLGRDPLLKRPVAVKIVHCLSEERSVLLQRFQREAELSARLNHPNIVSVFDVGDDPLVGPYLTMEYVDGTLLSRLVASGLDRARLCHLLIQAAGALKAAAEAGIAHRDVKPDNLIVGRDGRLKLMDFGIARGGESKLTQEGMVFGTPSYTAPELLVGGDPSPATDRWAFVVSVFEMLSGDVPFHGATVGATLYAVVHDEPVMPERWAPALGEVFRRALAKAPAQRYPDLTGFLHDLIEALALPPEARQQLLAFLAGDEPRGWEHPVHPGEASEPAPAPMDVPEPEPEPEPAPRPTPWFLRKSALVGVAAAGLAVVALGIGVLRSRSGWTVAVASQPSLADVLVDGQFRGRTPVTVKLAKDEAHLVRVEKEGFEPVSREVRPGDWTLHLVLRRTPYPVAILTEPPGAEVFLNGEPKGHTPLSGLWIASEGLQELRLRKPGYREWSVRLERERPLPSVIRLERE